MAFAYPADWPADGPIDLSIHDLPHNSSSTEWWYLNSHLETTAGAKFSLFASFFRRVVGEDERKQPRYAHSVIWAITDVDQGKYFVESMIDPNAPKIILEMLDKDQREDTLTERALREVLNKGNLPYPDRLIKNPVMINFERLELDFDGNCLTKQDDGSYRLELYSMEDKVGCNLLFHPEKPPIRHGDNGVVRGVSNEGMFYYFVPRCRVEGALIMDNQPLPVKVSSGWYDHEFGQHQYKEDDEQSDENIAWNWISAQLDNGWEISAYDLFNTVTEQSAGRWAIVIDPDGTRHHYTDFDFVPLNTWTSLSTFNSYPTQWRLTIPQAEISLDVEAAFADQEFITIISKPAFWEGRVGISGHMRGQQVIGTGYIERSGHDEVERIDEFFAAVGDYTRKEVQKLLPLDPTDEQLVNLIGSKRHAHYLNGIDRAQYVRTVIQPLREIVDRGGKTWRSYAFIACCNAVGGDATRFANWLAVPELMHVGSLIVDDVQDKSLVRRGGPSCHTIYGEPTAINAGTAAYFIGQLIINSTELTPEERLEIYELYFETLRATHAGQALDISGLHHVMAEAVESGNSEVLEQHILGTHRLKSAVPARVLGMIGAIVGKGSQEQICALGDFLEAMGLAFQIIDDTLNLRGFKNNLKSRGEDLSEGKVTMPVAKAMSRLPLDERRSFYQTLRSKSAEPTVIAALIDKLEACGALTASERHAYELIETAWKALDPLVEDSHVKLMLRAFSWYVLERHY